MKKLKKEKAGFRKNTMGLRNEANEISFEKGEVMEVWRNYYRNHFSRDINEKIYSHYHETKKEDVRSFSL